MDNSYVLEVNVREDIDPRQTVWLGRVISSLFVLVVFPELATVANCWRMGRTRPSRAWVHCGSKMINAALQPTSLTALLLHIALFS